MCIRDRDYDEQSRKLDEARWAARERRGGAAEQRDWDANSADRAARERGGPVAAPRTAGNARRALEPEELDAYLLGLLLDRLASAERLAALGIRDDGDAHAYAFALRPHERLGILRTLAGELLAADPAPPRALGLSLAA